METTLDRFGRIVIPKRIRDDLGLRAGSVLEVKEDSQKILLEPVQEAPRLIMKKGILVISATAEGDIEGAVRSHREDRLKKETFRVQK